MLEHEHVPVTEWSIPGPVQDSEEIPIKLGFTVPTVKGTKVYRLLLCQYCGLVYWELDDYTPDSSSGEDASPSNS